MIREILFIIICVVMCFEGGKGSAEKTVDDPDVYRNVSELITSKGYPVEEHTVHTADGYLLSLQRVPHGRNGTLDESEKKVVLLIHGVFCDASVWVLNFPDQSLGFVLADAGYDTWLLNTRGTTYSRKHVNLTTNQIKFWDFSFDELALYDIPDTIDYILESTRKETLYIIANSQGSTAVFAMLSEKPDFNDKVKLFIALAPVVFVWNSPSSLTSFIEYGKEISFLSKLFYSGEVLPNTGIIKTLVKRICLKTHQYLCKNLFFEFIGTDRKQCNQTRFGVYAAHYPSSTSVKSLQHYAQMFQSKKFTKFDYGHENFEHYNQEEPPVYELYHITSPVVLLWSSEDILADPKDIDILRKQLKSLVLDYRIPYEYNHADFLIAQNTPKIVNEPVLKLLSQF